MTLKKFIQMSTTDILCQSYKISERDKITAAFSLYDALSEFPSNALATELADYLSNKKQCVKTLASSHECPSSHDCNDCWNKYITRECRMFRRTSFFELIKGDKGKNMVEQVKSTEYIDWLYDALARRNGFLNGELILYANDEKDAQNGALLGVFLMYVGDLIAETDIENIADPAQCEVEKYLIQIKDKYFDICDLYGQGSVIFISELKEKPSSYFNLTP